MAITNRYGSGLFDLAKKYGIEDYVLGQSFDKYKPQMSASDIELGNKLLNYYNQENNAIEQHNTAVQKIDNNAKKQIEDAQINRTKAAHYLNNYNQANGLGGFGASQSSIIDLYNNYQNQRADIMGQADNNKLDLEAAFKTDSNNLYSKYSGEVDEQKKNYSAIAYANTSEELTQMLGSMIGADGKINEGDMEEINKWAEEKKKELYGEDLYQFEKDIGSIQVRDVKPLLEKKLEPAYVSEVFSFAFPQVVQGLKEKFGTSNLYDKKIPNGTTFDVGKGHLIYYNGDWYMAK